MVGLTYECVDFSAYVLFPEEADPTVVFGFENIILMRVRQS